jgi:hypothetical protein
MSLYDRPLFPLYKHDLFLIIYLQYRGGFTMAHCEYIDGCLFFHDRLSMMPSTSSKMKTMYCKGDFKMCARYMVLVKLGREKVPGDLYPNDREDAEEILRSG